MYYGHYKSSVVSQTGCVKEFVTTESDSLIFIPQVLTHCDLCNNVHGFRLYTVHMASTPKQKKSFNEFCEAKNLQQKTFN